MFVFLGSYFPSKRRWRFKVLILKFHCAITSMFKKGQNSKLILRNKIQDLFFKSFITIVLGVGVYDMAHILRPHDFHLCMSSKDWTLRWPLPNEPSQVHKSPLLPDQDTGWLF